MSSHTVIARRKTFDGKTICLWSDGLVTRALGHSIRGIGAARTDEAKELNLRAGWLALGEVCLYEADEVATLIKVARMAVRQDAIPAPLYLRTKTSEALSVDIMKTISWATTAADRDGKPTERTGTFARLSGLAHVAIFDSRRDYGSQGGRYAVHYLTPDRKGCTPGPPAYVAKTQRELGDFLGGLVCR